MLVQRFFSSIILAILFVAAIFFLPKWAFAVLTIVFCALGTYEFYALMEKKGIRTLKFLGTFIAAAIPFAVFKKLELTGCWDFLFIVSAILALFIVQFTRKKNDDAVTAISLTLFGVFYVSCLLSFLLKIFVLPHGNLFIFFLLVVTKMGDVAAYIGGSRFGKHLLIKRISPKKTVEGAVFAFITTLLLSCASKIYLPQIPLVHLFLLGIFLSILGQVGDLSESLIKRNCQIKDSGNLIPGFGGVLDLVDSILFAAPALYFYLIYTGIILK
ncbi:MAG: phosphatidate cytidylyltransferase [Candidatus Omnitrophota bacterium]